MSKVLVDVNFPRYADLIILASCDFLTKFKQFFAVFLSHFFIKRQPCIHILRLLLIIKQKAIQFN